jgi:hypothetical protein
MNNDDAFIRIYDSNDFEGGDHGHGHSHSHGHGDSKANGPGDEAKANGQGPTEAEMNHYNASMSKLKCVSFVSIFFIAA